MSEFPDADEQFELMYGDELDLLNEQENEFNNVPNPSVRRSLNFNTPSTSNTNAKGTSVNLNNGVQSSSFPSSNLENSSVLPQNNLIEQNNDSFSDFTELPHIENGIAELENSRKRTVTDLFGDIDDVILEDELWNYSKKFKQSEDEKRVQDLALIDEIVELRKLNREKQISVVLKKCRNRTYGENSDRDKYNISSSVPKYPFIGVRKHDGEKVYVRFHSADYEKDETLRILNDFSFKGVMGDDFKGVWEKARSLLNKHLDNETNENPTLTPQIDKAEELWVEKYKPKKYLELLSDDSTNRIMLKWIKLWDKVVFKRNVKIADKTSNGENFDQKNPNKHVKKFFNRFELSTKLDEFDRPEHKVALLCGPPGLGKTTLAHMVAKHAGYTVMEVNASDERSTEDFKKSLENATQMHSVEFENRPKCIIFDEIDGAPQASIDYLIKFINRVEKSTKEKSEKSKKSGGNILKRPIICICNDPYVPALRSLRQIAFVVNFPQTSNARLAERLMEIARKEQLKTSTGAMLALAEKSNSDIRSCLSVLQFFKAREKTVLLSDVLSVSVGQKDVQKGLFSVWDEIFQIPRTNRTLLNNKARMEKVLHTVHAFGDHERLAQGVFENYPKLVQKVGDFAAIDEAMEWFVFNDSVAKQIHALQNYSLSGYLSYAFVVWHFVFGAQQKPKLVYPSAGYEAKQRHTRQKAIISEVLRGMSPTLRCYCQPVSLLLDTLPYLTRIITPPFRPVSLHLYTKEEKEALLKVVNVMIDYNLNFVQERMTDGTYGYNLEPNIESLVVFKMEESKRKPLSYPNKQLISREIEMEKMRRTENCKQQSKKNAVEKQDGGVAALPNHMQKLQAKVVKSKSASKEKRIVGERWVKVKE